MNDEQKESPVTEYNRDALTMWGETISAQIRFYEGRAHLAIFHREGAPRSTEDGHPFELPPADLAMLRDLLNDAELRVPAA